MKLHRVSQQTEGDGGAVYTNRQEKMELHSAVSQQSKEDGGTGCPKKQDKLELRRCKLKLRRF